MFYICCTTFKRDGAGGLAAWAGLAAGRDGRGKGKNMSRTKSRKESNISSKRMRRRMQRRRKTKMEDAEGEEQ